MENTASQYFTFGEGGELNFNTSTVETFYQLKVFKDSKCQDSLQRIKLNSRVRLKTHKTFYNEVFSAPKSIVKRWARSINLLAVPGLYSDLDLETGRYEGGFKVWESTKDLVKFVTEDMVLNYSTLRHSDSFKVLELGGGASLPTMALISRILDDENFKARYKFHIHDYNWQVLATLTFINFAINFQSDFFQALLETGSLRFFHGDWSNFNRPVKYDLIMMSEVLYNSDNYESLHNLLASRLKRSGSIIIGTKDTYFGLNGSLYSWLEFVESKKILTVIKLVKITTANIPRSIVVMKKL